MQTRPIFTDRRPSERRILVNGRWQRLDTKAQACLAWLKASIKTDVNSTQGGANGR
jgi:hypothetical protein